MKIAHIDIFLSRYDKEFLAFTGRMQVYNTGG
jgi:hypothetical protein